MSVTMTARHLTADLLEGAKGFTVDVDSGEPVTSGVSVGGNPKLGEVRLSNYMDHPIILHEFLEFYARLVPMNDEGVRLLGGWVHDGDLYLDAPEIYMNPEEAIAVARERGELAVYDIGGDDEITL